MKGFDLEAVQPFLNAMHVVKDRFPFLNRIFFIEIACLYYLGCIMSDSRFCLPGQFMGWKGAQSPAVESLFLSLVENVLQRFS